MDETPPTGRGQSSIDFAVAVGVFLLTFTTVVAFLPELTEPFTTSPAATPLVADRVASQLVDAQLAGGSVGTLDTTCTLYFFNTTAASTPCDTFASTDSLNDKLGLGDDVFVNVTVEQVRSGSNEVLCGEKPLSDGAVVDPPCSDSDEFALGLGDETPSGASSVSVARRGGFLDGRQDVVVYVRVWT